MKSQVCYGGRLNRAGEWSTNGGYRKRECDYNAATKKVYSYSCSDGRERALTAELRAKTILFY
jgi:hypothetical protein